MKKITIILLMVVFMSGNAVAFPWKKVLTLDLGNPKVRTAVFIVGATEGSALWNTLEVINCRNRAGVEKCETRYGAWKQSLVTDHVLAGIMIPITYALKHQEEKNGDRIKTWPFIPLAVAGGFSYAAMNQRGQQQDKRVHCDEGLKFNGIKCE